MTTTDDRTATHKSPLSLSLRMCGVRTGDTGPQPRCSALCVGAVSPTAQATSVAGLRYGCGIQPGISGARPARPHPVAARAQTHLRQCVRKRNRRRNGKQTRRTSSCDPAPCQYNPPTPNHEQPFTLPSQHTEKTSNSVPISQRPPPRHHRCEHSDSPPLPLPGQCY
jgi:hypothetical protein